MKSFEETSTSTPDRRMQLTPRGRRLGNFVAAGLVVGGVLFIGSLDRAPTMTGKQSVEVDTGDTLTSLINEHVEHGRSYTGDVTVHARNNPDNRDVFENGQLDEGEVLELPESVSN